MRVDQHHGAALDREAAGELLHHLEEEPVGIAARREGARDVEERGEVLRLAQHLVAIAPRPGERAEQRRKIRRGVRRADETVQPIGDAGVRARGEDSDQRAVTLPRQRDQLVAILGGEIDHRGGVSGRACFTFQKQAGAGKRIPERFIALADAQQGDCQWPVQSGASAPSSSEHSPGPPGAEKPGGNQQVEQAR